MSRPHAINLQLHLLGAWTLLVLSFFLFSTEARSLYVFPMLPAFALIVDRRTDWLFQRTYVRRIIVALPLTIALAMICASLYALANPNVFDAWLANALDVARISGELLIIAFAMLSLVIMFRRRSVMLAYAASMIALWLGLTLLVASTVDGTRTGANLARTIETQIPNSGDLAIVAWPEQFLPQWKRPANYFGYRHDPVADVRDAVGWLSGSSTRRLVMPGNLLQRCFDPATSYQAVGRAHRQDWVLVDRGSLSSNCGAPANGRQQVVLGTPTPQTDAGG